MDRDASTDFVEIDGSTGEGGGQIIRTAVSLSCVFGRPVKITNVRANRKQPGLRPQHVQAVRSAAEITNSTVEGAEIGGRTIQFMPGKADARKQVRIDTGTAGSTTLIAQTLIPIGIFCRSDLELEIIGGTENPLSPTVDYLRRVLVPFCHAIGALVTVDVQRRGYYPRGGGIIRVQVLGSRSSPHPIDLTRDQDEKSDAEPAQEVRIVSVSRLLPDHVPFRQAESARKVLEDNEVKVARPEIDSTGQALSPGSSILVYRTTHECFIGADSLGEKGRRAEDVGGAAATEFLKESSTTPALDSHLADMAVTLLCCVSGKSQYTTARISRHLETNLQVAKAITRLGFEIQKTKAQNYKITLDQREIP